MPSYIISLQKDATDDEVASVKQQVRDNGGTIDKEYSIIKGFSATLPEVHAESFASHPKVANVEKDQEVRTQ
ncbi:hypothetical protein BJY04DRAFT_188013 [Aspergillus karnatakaensis]|uniref:uncharacterized protein n=1 Tax=Aspergillus karnatakaensis TaxID=1810916 RepID=UPI003CCCC36E